MRASSSSSTGKRPPAPRCLGRASRQGLWPLRGQHRHRALRPPGRPGDEKRALRLSSPGVLGGRQRFIRRWRINVHSDRSLGDIASFINPIVRGGATTTGASTSPGCIGLSGASTNTLFVGPEVRRKFKRLRTSARRAWRWLRDVQHRAPALFAHWSFGALT